MPGPPFTVMGRGQQTVDQAFIRLRGIIAHEGIDLVRRGRESDQPEAHPANELLFGGGRGRAQAAGLEFGKDEGVDGISDPVSLANGGRCHSRGGAEEPMMHRLRVCRDGAVAHPRQETPEQTAE